jgi:Protein of unknown function (DUF2924)
MSKSIASQVARLQNMTVAELRVEWEKVFGEPTKQRHRVYLWKRLARRIQEPQLPRLDAADSDKVEEYRAMIRRMPPDEWFPGKQRSRKAQRPPRDRRSPSLGSVITRQYKDHEIAVTVLDGGFEFEGQVFRSLSAIAKVITGTTWSGPAFFGLRKGSRL